MTDFTWWQHGVVYQIYPRSYKDTTGNGVGDLQGIIDKLDYLNDGTPKSLGIDAIWISPFYPSPMKDFGYDVADYVAIDPLFGDLETFDKLIAEAHKRGIKIIIDYVPNHTSDEHAWFIESRSSRDNPKRDWYIWRDAKADGSPPNNWGSVFGGSAWEWDETTQQYYFHQFVTGQPDLNWRNPEVRQAMHDVLRFWMQRGVDGFRMDVVYMIWKHPDMPDQPVIEGRGGRGDEDLFGRQEQIYSFNYDGIHDQMREIRQVLNEFENDGDEIVGIGEIWLPLEERVRYYGAGDELHMPFNFDFISIGDWDTPTDADAATMRRIVDTYEAQVPEHGWPNYVLGNHDVARLASRVGPEKARVCAMMLLTLRGTPTIYQGEELGMENGIIEPHQIQDPQGKRFGVQHTRDVSRTPMQWDDSQNAGFSDADDIWLPVHPDYKTRNVQTQSDDPKSMLTLYRRLLWLRKQSEPLMIGRYAAIDAPDGVFAYVRQHDNNRVVVALNFSDQDIRLPLPGKGDILLSTYLDIETTDHVFVTLRPYEGVIVAMR